jgi:ABC-type spermidine/putrescine transport system permease subunit II
VRKNRTRVTINKQQREVHMSLRKGIIVGVVVTVLASFLGTPPVVWAEEMGKPTGTEITFDLIIARPVGMVSCALGTTIFIATFPFAIATGSAKNTAHALVAEPYNFTFVRGLGEY